MLLPAERQIFLPELRVGQHSDEDAADHRTRLETDLPAVFRLIPVAERYAGRRFVEPGVKRGDQRFEVVAFPGQHRAPDDPVEFRVAPAAVERQAVAGLDFPVVRHFGPSPSSRSQTRLYFWLQLPGRSKARR